MHNIAPNTSRQIAQALIVLTSIGQFLKDGELPEQIGLLVWIRSSEAIEKAERP